MQSALKVKKTWEDLCKWICKDPIWGSSIWVCLKRGLQPQATIRSSLKLNKLWTDELEALKRNPDGRIKYRVGPIESLRKGENDAKN